MKIDPVDIIIKINDFLNEFEDQRVGLIDELSRLRSTANNQNFRKRAAENEKLKTDSDLVQKKYRDIINKTETRKNTIFQAYEQLRSDDSKFKEVSEKSGPILHPVVAGNLDEKIILMNNWSDDFVKTFDEIKQFKARGVLSKAFSSKKINELYSNLTVLRSNIATAYEAIISGVMEETSIELDSLSDIASQNIQKIQLNHQKELEQIDIMELKDIDALAENAITMLDKLFSNTMIEDMGKKWTLSETSRIVFSNKFREEFAIGTLKFDVAEFCSNKGLVDLVVDKFASVSTGTILSLPLCIDIYNKNNLLIIHNEEGSSLATETAGSIMLSFLSAMVPELFKLYVMDPQNKGRSVTPFLGLKECDDTQIIEIATDEESIYAMLRALNEDMLFIIQNKLGNKYEDVWHYNENNENKPIRMKLLTIYDFPKGFSQRAYEMLIEIMENAHSCGIFVNILYNGDIKKSRYENHDSYLENIFEHCNSVIRVGSDGVTHARTSLEFRPLPIPSSKNLNEFLERYQEAFLKKKDAVPTYSFSDMHKGIFYESSSEYLDIPVGGNDEGVVSIEFGTGTSHHMLLAGATGSGKSTFLHTLILSMISKYSPEELNLYLMDFKSGTEFKIYDRSGIPHIKLLAIDAMQEFGESILEEICNEIERRSELFKDTGTQDLKGYISMGNRLPRIVIIIDEFQTLFDETANRVVAERCAGYASEIVAKGRSFGVHLIISTQTMKIVLERISLKNTTIEQMRSRIGMKCGEYDASFLFKDANNEALEKMKGSIGKAVYTKEYTSDGLKELMITHIPDSEKIEILEKIATECGGKYDSNLRVFEGRREIDMPTIQTYEDVENVKIYIGEPIAVAPSIELNIGHRKSSNVLIVGNNAKIKQRLEGNILYSLSKNQSVDIFAVEGSVIIGDGHCSKYFETMKNKIKRCSSNEEIIQSICELYDILSSRKISQFVSNIICLYISDCQWLEIVNDMLRGERVVVPENDAVHGSENVTTKLLSIVREGGSFGIFTVITSDRASDMIEALGYPERLLNNMNHRLSFSLNERETDVLIGGGMVCTEKNGVAYYSDGVRQAIMFKPFRRIA